MNVSELCRRLGTAEWRWELSDVTQVLGPIYREPVQKTARRITYRSPLGLDASVYHKDGRVFLIEDTFQVLLHPERLSPEDYDREFQRYLLRYRTVVGEVSQAIGRPTFDGKVGTEGFPEDQDAIWLAQWSAPNARLLVELKHEDKELPLRLGIIVVPPEGQA
jgi:hypothetical protein